jgi:hypothetical protein
VKNLAIFLYKMRKMDFGEIFKISLGVSFLFASSPIIILIIFISDIIDKSSSILKKIGIISIFALTAIINFGTILFMDSYKIGIIYKLLLATAIDFGFYFPILIFIMFYQSYVEINLTIEEKRDFNISNVLSKFRYFR